MSSKQKDIDAIVGCVLRRTRLASGHTRLSLAAHCGVTHQQLQKYEAGTNRVSVSRLFVLSGALGVSPLEFISQVQESIELGDREAVDTEWERLRSAKPEYCRKIIARLETIHDRAVLQSVLNLLGALDQNEERVER